MAISEYEKIIGRLQIECDWKRLPSCIYSTGSPSAIEKEAEALHSIGVKANVTDATELPFPGEFCRGSGRSGAVPSIKIFR